MRKVILINLTVLTGLLWLADLFVTPAPVKTVKPFRAVNLREHGPGEDRVVSPSDTYMQGTQNLVQQPCSLRTDRNGFIIGPDREVTDSLRPDIIFFGGSTTECLFLAENERFPYLVGTMLASRNSNAPILVANAGKSGNNTWHSVIGLLTKGLPSRPDVVVLMHNVNDLSQLTKTGSYHRAPKSRAIIQQVFGSSLTPHEPTGIGSRLKHALTATGKVIAPNIISRLAHTAQEKKQSASSDEWADFRDVAGSFRFEDAVTDYEDALRLFIYSARSHGISPVLMTQFNRLTPDDSFTRSRFPTNAPFDYETTCGQYARFNDAIRQLAATENVPVIDLERMVAQDSTAIYDDVHLNAAGSRLVADSVSAHLTRIFPDRFVLGNNAPIPSDLQP